jgi:membrane protein
MLTTLGRFVAILRARATEIEPLDRGFALGSRLFIAVLPLSLVAQQLTSRDTTFGAMLTSAFRLEGTGREAAETLFAPPDDLGAGLGLFALIVLLFALRGFARGLQRLYLDLWRVRLSGPSAIAHQVTWALWLAAYVVVDIALAGVRLDGGAAAWLAVLGGVAIYVALWAMTPTLLLARRVDPRRLAPTIILTVVAVTTFEIVSRVYFPTLATGNAERYGLIGFAFSLFSWFFVNQTIVVLAALLGAVVDEARRGPAPSAAGLATPPARLTAPAARPPVAENDGDPRALRMLSD